MFTDLDALIALADHGTMGRAAVALHVTQSAVSKRLANLEHHFRRKLIERAGRRVRITPAGNALLARARPLIADLKDYVLEEQAEAEGRLVVDLSVSVLVGWGAAALAAVRAAKPGLTLQLGSYHASVAVERVRSGESMLALVQGKSEAAPDLAAQLVIDEPLVIVPSQLAPFRLRRGSRVPVLAMEPHTEAWSFTARGLRALCAQTGIRIERAGTLQSFSAIAQMARAGFGHGLVPIGVAQALGIGAASLLRLPRPGVTVPVSLIGRRTTLARPLVQEFYKALLKAVSATTGL